MNFNEILTNPLYEPGSLWQRAAPCPSRGADDSAPPLLSGGVAEVWGEVTLGPARAREVPVGAGASPLQPPRSCGSVGGRRRSPGPGFTPRARSFCTGFLRLPLRSCAPGPDSQPALQAPLRSLPRADGPPSSRQRPSLQQGCLLSGRGPRQGCCLPRALVLPPYLPHTLLPRPQDGAGHTSAGSAQLPVSLTALRLTEDRFTR